MKLLFSTLILLLCFFNARADFQPGHYYKHDGTKVTGWLRFHYGGNVFSDKSDGDCYLSFKPEENGKRITLTTNDVCCFVIGKDSFAIVKNFKFSPLITYPQDFAQVVAAGKINLYLYYSIVNTGGQYHYSYTKTDWIIEKDGKFDKLTRPMFKELMPLYLSDFPGLLKQVNDGTLCYEDSVKIINMYNEQFR